MNRRTFLTVVLTLLSIAMFNHFKQKLHQHADQYLHQPGQPPQASQSPVSAPASAPASSQGHRCVVYFCNWAIYARKHVPSQLPADRITHILYAFANIDPESGKVSLTDPWADLDCQLGPEGAAGSNPELNEDGRPRGGCLGQFYKLKTENPHLRVLLSVGGWSYAANFARGVETPQKRQAFVKSAVELVQKHAFDGLDFDWEYPNDSNQAQQLVDLLRLARLELDTLALRNNMTRNQYDLTVATAAGVDNFSKLDIRAMDQYLTFWNIMTYDFAGSWSQQSDLQANLYGNGISGDGAVRGYISRGATPQKIVLGLPIYGRAFQNTSGLGKPFRGVGSGSWEDGVWDYKALPLPDSKESVDKQRVGAYCYSSKSQTLVSYDNLDTAQMKADYVRNSGLGGVMFWESSADKPPNSGQSLIVASTDRLSLQRQPNNLHCKH